MGLIQFSRSWERQPPFGTQIDRSTLVGRSLRRLVDIRRWDKELIEDVSVSAYTGGSISPSADWTPYGEGRVFSLAVDNGQVSVPAWTNVTNEGFAFCVIHRPAGGNYDWWELGTAGSLDHWPFSGLAYTDAFWSSRWMNGVAAPSWGSFNALSVIVVSVKSGRQTAWWNGRLWHSNTLTGGFTLPGNLLMVRRASEAKHVLVGAGDRALTDGEAASLSANPWQLFEPRRIWVPQAAITGLPTLSASTYKPGTLTATGWTPRITAT